MAEAYETVVRRWSCWPPCVTLRVKNVDPNAAEGRQEATAEHLFKKITAGTGEQNGRLSKACTKNP